eukprot:gene17704-20166_t
MGSSHGVATIHVSFDNHDAVVAGSTVSGKVYLMVHQDCVSCVSVGCRVVGREKTRVTYTVTVGHGEHKRTERRIAHEQRNFMDVRFCLQHVPGGNIYKGQYEYPFQFTIPPGAPASMSAGGNPVEHFAPFGSGGFETLSGGGGYGGDHCCIDYAMETWLDRPGLLRWDIRHKIRINVTNIPPFGSKTPLYIEPNRYPLYSMCCIPRGQILIGGSATPGVLTAGGQTCIKYAVENLSTVKVKAIEVLLSEHITFRARHHRAATYHTLYHRRLSPQEIGLDLSARPSEKLENTDGFESLRVLSKMLESDTYKLDFTLPSSARSTYNGSIIQVTHKLEIKAITTFGSANPTVWRHMKIYSKESTAGAYNNNNQASGQATPSALPANWQPTVAETVRLPELGISSSPQEQDDSDDEKDDHKPISYTSALATDRKYKSFDELLVVIKQTYDPCGELEKYIRDGNPVADMTPEQFFACFKVVNDVFDQQRFADILSDAMTEVSCVKVARAVAGSKDMCKREVAEKLLSAGLIVDKEENAHLIKAELSAFQFMTVEKYLK